MKTCIHTLIKDERLYIKEWVDYHLSLGFDDIFIYEDKGSQSHKDIFEGYDNVHINSIIDTNVGNYNLCKGQFLLMHYALNKLKNENIYDWCLFSDNDEFLMFDKGYDLYRLCDEFKVFPGVFLAWKMYNANGHIKRPVGSIIDNYTQVVDFGIDGGTMWNKKTFVNLKLGNTWLNNHCIKGGVDVLFNPNPHAKKVFQKAWLNHYFCKSFEDFTERMVHRGNMGNDNRNFDQFFFQNPDLIDKKNDLIESVRYLHLNNVQYISKELKLISGGNINTIQNLINEKNK